MCYNYNKGGLTLSEQKKIGALRSKLTIYRNGLERAKEKGDVSEICAWVERMRSVRREIRELL